MRKIAFGYSNRCNIRCSHCVAAGDKPVSQKMELDTAKSVITKMAAADVAGISFTAGEPFIYLDDMLELVDLCSTYNIYSRIVTNSYWAKTAEAAYERLRTLKQCGLNQLRLSYSRWHQDNVPPANILNAAQACKKFGVDYFVSFVTDFSEKDDLYEKFLREHNLKFFAEPVIYAGRAGVFERKKIHTDFQANRCAMNPYLAPDLTMYACCDAGSHFNNTNVFLLGNLETDSIEQLFTKSEALPLYNCIRNIGITNIASFSGMNTRDIVTYRKCELCEKLFNSPETLERLNRAAGAELQNFYR